MPRENSPHFQSSEAARRLQRGYGTTVQESRDGRSLSLLRASGVHHPWKTTAAWSATARQFVATVETGFVNAVCPLYRTTVLEQTGAGGPDFGLNPLTGQPFFSAGIFAQGSAKTVAVPIDVPLYLAPALTLPWQAIGPDGAGPVPDFFVNRGVPKTSFLPAVSEDGSAAPAPQIPSAYRLLRSCDLWIQQPRLALTSDITLQPGPATGISNVTQTLGVRSSLDVLRIFSGALPEQSQSFDPLAGTYEEPTWDQFLISTVFALSPLNAALFSNPDPSWQIFVRHHAFWHLAWDQPPLRQIPSDPGTPFIPPLAGGAAQLVINFLTASLNDMTDQALNILAGHSLAGSFWTVTGGGHDNTILTPTDSAPKYGLNKAARLEAEAAAQAAAVRAQQLDPAFPYQAERFPLSLLSA